MMEMLIFQMPRQKELVEFIKAETTFDMLFDRSQQIDLLELG